MGNCHHHGASFPNSGSTAGRLAIAGAGTGAQRCCHAPSFPSSSHAGSSTPGESPNLSTSGAGTMPLAFRAAKGLQGY